jgi:glycosyltransferase involved in cell wall biosynthesis
MTSVSASGPAAGAFDPRGGTVHLVYPHGSRLSAPDAIGRELGKRLERRYPVRYYDWDARETIHPADGDVLLGHPHPNPATVFRMSLDQPGWRRRLMIAPFHHGDLQQVAFEDGILPKCDRFLAITGRYWFRSIPESKCSHWEPRMTHLDLAVDRRDYPQVKTEFSPLGKRRVAYIGHTRWMKNTPYLSSIADLLPGTNFGWFGRGDEPIRGFRPHGQVDFASPQGRSAVAQYDLLLTVGTADANPTTILEAMAWGLIPVCTPQSGYEGVASIPNVPLGDAPAAAAVVRRLLEAPESDLVALQAANWKLLDELYSWDRFAADVMDAIDGTDRVPLGRESLGRQLQFRWYSAISPWGFLGRLSDRRRRVFGRARSALS